MTKYPRTYHLPFSPGATSDDKILKNTACLAGREVVVTVKMDGENTTLYGHGFHARSLDSRHHPSRDWLARFHGSIAHDIPAGWRICGENLYARHSIAYEDLKSYFLGFSIWDETNQALSWDATLAYFSMLGIEPVKELYRGPFDQGHLQGIARDLDTARHEGFVVRLADRFAYEDFNQAVAKWVRPGHVQTTEHWMHSAVVPNKLAAA